MVHLIKEFEAWHEKYEGNILEYTHEGTGIPYFVNIDALRTDVDDGMYDVELSNGSHPYIASNQVCIVDGMVVLETLKIVINESIAYMKEQCVDLCLCQNFCLFAECHVQTSL